MFVNCGCVGCGLGDMCLLCVVVVLIFCVFNNYVCIS